MACVLHVARSWSPDTTVILGDWLDGAAFSSHGIRSFAEKAPAFVADEVGPCNAYLDKLQGRSNRPLVYCEGNHEARIERYATGLGAVGADLYALASPQRLLAHRVDSRGVPHRERKHFTWVPYLGRGGHSHYQITPRLKSSSALVAIHGWSVAQDAARVHLNAARDHSVVHGHCLPLTYEVLTRRGWVTLADITTDDIALCYTPQGMTWSPVRERVEYRYSGEMAVFNHHDIRMRMTDRHHVYTADGRYIPVREAIASGVAVCDLPYSGTALESTEYPVTDDEIRLVVAYCADGHIAHNARSIRWHLKKQRKIDRLTSLITAMGYSVSWSDLSPTGSRKTKALSRGIVDRLIELAPTKTLPLWFLDLSARQRRIAIDEISLWDGSKLWSSCRQYQSVKRNEVDIAQAMLAQHGLFTARRASGQGVQWNESIQSRRKVTLADIVTWESVTDEPVGCITTDPQNFVFRDDTGKVQVSGNTHRAQTVTSRNRLTGELLQAWSPGCLCDLNPTYMANQPSDWTHGFSMVYVGATSWISYTVPIFADGSCILPDGKRIVG